MQYVPTTMPSNSSEHSKRGRHDKATNHKYFQQQLEQVFLQTVESPSRPQVDYYLIIRLPV